MRRWLMCAAVLGALAVSASAVTVECSGTASTSETNGMGDQRSGSLKFKGSYLAGSPRFLVSADGGKRWVFAMTTSERSYSGTRIGTNNQMGSIITYTVEINRMTGEIDLQAQMTQKPTVISGRFDYQLSGSGQCVEVSAEKPKF